MLERGSGLYTGSGYDDKMLKESMFPGEGINGPRVLVVKLHEIPSYIQASFKVVFLIRNPFEVIWSHFQLFVTSNHAGIVPAQRMQHEDTRIEFQRCAFR